MGSERGTGGERGAFLGAGGVIGGGADDVGQRVDDIDVVCDVAASVEGLPCMTGIRGVSRGEPGGV
jgi:6-phosphogluconate dehydrogenase